MTFSNGMLFFAEFPERVAMEKGGGTGECLAVHPGRTVRPNHEDVRGLPLAKNKVSFKATKS